MQQKPEPSTHPINIPTKPRDNTTDLCNDSISSVDSNGRDDATSNSLLEQCIQSGINKVVRKDSSAKRAAALVTSSPKKSMLPKPGSGKSTTKKSLDRKDEELLQECIKTGILQATKNEVDHLQENITNMSLADPKNGESTSVIAQGSYPLQCASTITDVEVDTSANSHSTRYRSDQEDDFIGSRDEPSHQASWTTQNGYELNMSYGSCAEDNILERSNEYPAGKLSIMTSGFDLDDGSESMMEISNEFMVENEKLADAKIDDKHKDPDLMMRSVERLTQEFVLTAEYLRKTTLSDEISKMSGSNTWNDENSFPSISLSAPIMIGSTNDETTFASDNQVNPIMLGKPTEQQNLDDKTPTNENYVFPADECDAPTPKIDFKVGGEIGAQSLSHKVNYSMSFGPMSIETNSTMSNSTIVQVEANRIANRINSMTSKLVDSTTSLMDLERVRPPSSMDCMSWTAADSVSQSPMRKKMTLSGIVAKRAVAGQHMQTHGGSVESVNSILNLDSIRPPSLMDELLDSMISVDSIVSEMVIDPTLTLGVSRYETALSDMEDSLTLRSCQDLSKDETLTGTGTSDDFSSVESTPKKRRNIRSTTPKQRRQIEKERYKTYTIQMDMVMREQEAHSSSQSPEDPTGSPRRSLSARQRRQEDRHRYESQSIEHSPSPVNRRRDNPDRYKTFNIDQSNFDEDHSIRAMTENFEFLRNATSAMNANGIDTNEIRTKLNRIRAGRHHLDDSLEYERQTSETESQRDARNTSSSNDANSSAEHEDSSNSTPTPPEPQPQPKVVRPKNCYVSPYRKNNVNITPATSKIVTCVQSKTKMSKVTKTPVIVKAVNKTPPTSPKINGAKPRLNLIKPAATVNVKSSIPKPTTTPTLEVPPPTPPIRQGTFIQDEPTLENVPIVHDVPPTPQPAKSPPSKLKPPTSRAAPSSAPRTPSTPTKKNSLVAGLPQLKFRSNSNASMKPPTQLVAQVKPVRSNTGINLSNQRKNVTSKIAGLWKGGNANDKKESPTTATAATTKKPISNSPSQMNGGGLKHTPSMNNGYLRRTLGTGTKEKIKRSSTCEEIGEFMACQFVMWKICADIFLSPFLFTV